MTLGYIVRGSTSNKKSRIGGYNDPVTYIFFILGLFVGSFLNVLILRHGTGFSTVKGRSKCFSCNKNLEWYELVPVFSYLVLFGKCSQCKTKISTQYILVELLTGVVFATIYYLYSLGQFNFYYLLLYLAIFANFIIIAVYDLRHKIIPDEWSLSLGMLTLIIAIGRFVSIDYVSSIFRYVDLFAGLICFLPFYFLWKFSDGHWMGLGDGKLAIGIGFLLGIAEGISAIALAFWIGAIFSVSLLIIQRVIKKLSLNKGVDSLTMKSEVPFAPFLILSTLIVFIARIDLLSLHAFGF